MLDEKWLLHGAWLMNAHEADSSLWQKMQMSGMLDQIMLVVTM